MADAALGALKASGTHEGLRGTFLEQDGELPDGLIEYLPPSNPTQKPDPNGTCFTVSSCQYPAGFIDDPVAYRSYSRILHRLDAREGPKPRFALFVGDQVYVDATAGLYDPTSQYDQYRLPYEAWLRQRHVRELLRRIPSFMLLDDHEIEDNWEPQACPDNQQNADKKKYGVEAFHKYQRGISGGLESFVFDGFHFFMLDTRTERTHRKVGILGSARLFKNDRMNRLKEWLLTSPGPKFVATPAMFLPRHRVAVQHNSALNASNLSALRSDSWDGYPNTLREVLAFIAANKIQHVVFLSGDEHRGSIAKADLLDSEDNLITRIHSIHTAAMYAPLAFANALDEDIVDKERIAIDDPQGRFTCVVEATRPPPGDGATVVFIRQTGTDWLLDYEFADGNVITLTL
jgi:cholesterol oxidase